MKAVLASVLLLAVLVSCQKPQPQQQTKPDMDTFTDQIMLSDKDLPSKLMISESKPIHLKGDLTMIKTNSLTMVKRPIKAVSNKIYIIDNSNLESESREFMYKLLNEQKEAQLKDDLLFHSGSSQQQPQDPYEKVKFVAVLSVMGSVLLATLIMTMYLCLKNDALKSSKDNLCDPKSIKA